MISQEVATQAQEAAASLSPWWVTNAPVLSAIFSGGMLLVALFVAIWNVRRAREAEKRAVEAEQRLASTRDKEFSRLYLAAKQMQACFAFSEDLHHEVFPKDARVAPNENVDPQILAMRIGRVWAASRAAVTTLVGILSQVERKLTPQQVQMLRKDPELDGYLKTAMQGSMHGANLDSKEDTEEDGQASDVEATLQ